MSNRTCVNWQKFCCMFGSICHLAHVGPGGCTPEAPGQEVGRLYHQYNMNRSVCKNYLISGKCTHEGMGNNHCRLLHLDRDMFVKDGGAAAIQAAQAAGGRIPRAAPSANAAMAAAMQQQTQDAGSAANNSHVAMMQQQQQSLMTPAQQQQQQQQDASFGDKMAGAASGAIGNKGAVGPSAKHITCPRWVGPTGCAFGALCINAHPPGQGRNHVDAPSDLACSAFDPFTMCRPFFTMNHCQTEGKSGKRCPLFHFSRRDLEQLAQILALPDMGLRVDDILTKYMHLGATLHELALDSFVQGVLRTVVKAEVRRAEAAAEAQKKRKSGRKQQQGQITHEDGTGEVAAAAAATTTTTADGIASGSGMSGPATSMALSPGGGGEAAQHDQHDGLAQTIPHSPTRAAAAAGEEEEKMKKSDAAAVSAGGDEMNNGNDNGDNNNDGDDDDGIIGHHQHHDEHDQQQQQQQQQLLEAMDSLGSKAADEEIRSKNIVVNAAQGQNDDDDHGHVQHQQAAKNDDDDDDDDDAATDNNNNNIGIVYNLDKLSPLAELWCMLIGDDQQETVEAVRNLAHTSDRCVLSFDAKLEATIVSALTKMMSDDGACFLLLELISVSPTTGCGVPRALLRVAFRLLNQRIPVAMSVARRSAQSNPASRVSRYVIESCYHDYLAVAIASIAQSDMMQTSDGMILVGHAMRCGSRSRNNSARDVIMGVVFGVAPTIIDHSSGNHVVADLLRACAEEPERWGYVVRSLWMHVEQGATGINGNWSDLIVHRFAYNSMLALAECATADVVHRMAGAHGKLGEEKRVAMMSDARSIAFIEALLTNANLRKEDCDAIVHGVRPAMKILQGTKRGDAFVERMQKAMKRTGLAEGRRRPRDEDAALGAAAAAAAASAATAETGRGLGPAAPHRPPSATPEYDEATDSLVDTVFSVESFPGFVPHRSATAASSVGGAAAAGAAAASSFGGNNSNNSNNNSVSLLAPPSTLHLPTVPLQRDQLPRAGAASSVAGAKPGMPAAPSPMELAVLERQQFLAHKNQQVPGSVAVATAVMQQGRFTTPLMPASAAVGGSGSGLPTTLPGAPGLSGIGSNNPIALLPMPNVVMSLAPAALSLIPVAPSPPPPSSGLGVSGATAAAAPGAVVAPSSTSVVNPLPQGTGALLMSKPVAQATTTAAATVAEAAAATTTAATAAGTAIVAPPATAVALVVAPPSSVCIQRPPPFLVRDGTKRDIPPSIVPIMWPPPIRNFPRQQQQQQPVLNDAAATVNRPYSGLASSNIAINDKWSVS